MIAFMQKCTIRGFWASKMGGKTSIKSGLGTTYQIRPKICSLSAKLDASILRFDVRIGEGQSGHDKCRPLR